MALRNIRLSGDDLLRKKAREVVIIDSRLTTLLDDMTDTLREANGAGLAAPQVGVLKRAIVVSIDEECEDILEMINPVIIHSEGEQCLKEGCLSLPNETGYVKRPMYVKVKYRDRDGIDREIEGEERLAVAICHEVDHLDGILYTDKLELDYVGEDDD